MNSQMENLLKFLETNSLYIVLFVVLIIWSGIFLYILSLDNKIKKIEKKSELIRNKQELKTLNEVKS